MYAHTIAEKISLIGGGKYAEIVKNMGVVILLKQSVISRIVIKELEQFNTNKEIKIISKGNKAIHKFYTSRLGENRNIP